MFIGLAGASLCYSLFPGLQILCSTMEYKSHEDTAAQATRSLPAVGKCHICPCLYLCTETSTYNQQYSTWQNFSSTTVAGSQEPRCGKVQREDTYLSTIYSKEL